jgi:hypothetical protein
VGSNPNIPLAGGSVLSVNLLFFEILGFELRAYTLSHSTSPFLVKGIFKIRSQLFAWAGFEPQSSWSLPPE